jgi:UDPglucose--hexose-1-phosphate uridylyltransferase
MEEKKSHLRRDAHHGGWVLLPDQPEREQLLALPKEKWPKGNDALCHPEKAGANIIHRLEARQADGKQHVVRVIANRFALYKVEGQEDREGRGMYDLMRNVGAHEIIIESESHQDTLCTMSPQHYALALRAMQDRIHDLRNDVRLKSFSIFREWQLANGDARQHPHSQLIASAIIPLGLKNELDSAWEYYDYKERCLFCDMVRQELSDKERIVKESPDFITYCPFASRNAFEIHLFPKQHHAWFSELPHEKLTALAEMIRDTACRLEEAIPGWRVMMALHSAPAPDKRQKPHNRLSNYYHWHIEFLPIPPGFVDWYVRTGTHVECTPPENAAEYLRKIDVASPWG